jgi:hypothetical protein
MNVEIGTEAAQFSEKEYINGIFFAVLVPLHCQCDSGRVWAWPGYLYGRDQDICAAIAMLPTYECVARLPVSLLIGYLCGRYKATCVGVTRSPVWA